MPNDQFYKIKSFFTKNQFNTAIIKKFRSLIKRIKFRHIEGIGVLIGIYIGLCTLGYIKDQIKQTDIQIDQIQKQIEISNRGYETQKEYEKLKFIHEIYRPFETEPNASLLYAYRSRDNEFLKQYSEDDTVELLNHIEYVTWVGEKVGLDKESMRTNFGWIFDAICDKNYIVGEKGVIKKRGTYGGILKVCKEGF